MSLLEQVRNTRTIDGSVAVYANAVISLINLHPDLMSPTALYVVSSQIARINEIGDTLFKRGIDIFNLTEVVYESGYTIGPPLVEVFMGKLAIVDGIHRCWLARKWGYSVNTIVVENAELPLCSRPVRWRNVKVYNEKPTNPRKLRSLLVEDKPEELRRLYRDLSYLGSQGRRPRDGQYG